VRIASVFGGVSINPQITALRDSQIIVATPGRLMDHLERRTFKTESITFLVFDEADRMFDMGFYKDMERIVKQLPTHRQTLLFSATMPDPIKKLATQHQHNPVHVKTHTHVEEHLLPQFFYRVDPMMKFSLLVHLIKTEDPKLAIIFHQTKHGAKALARNLQKQGFNADAMHGNLSQAQRDMVIAKFKTGKIHLLVATDVAARGLDVKHISHVFNYNVPKVPDEYIHRIGRTARAGESGKAITLIEPTDQYQWRDIMRLPNAKATELHAHGYPSLQYTKGSGTQESPQRGRSPRGFAKRPSDGQRSSSFGKKSFSGFGKPRSHDGPRRDDSERSSDGGSYKRSDDGPRSEGRTQFGDRPRKRFNKPKRSFHR
jgi:ATP-dependent RNA helicase DeaD